MARHGENIRKRKDGRWEARYIASYDDKGKAVYRSVYAYTYDEAKAKRAKASASLENAPAALKNDLTFVQVADLWLNARKEVVKVSSYNHYRNQLESHIIPDLVNYRFSSLTSADINTLLKNKVAPPFRTAEFDIIFGKGICKIGNILDVAVNLDIVKKSGSWFSFNEEKLGQGRDKAKEYLAEHSDILSEVERLVREKLAEE